MKRPPLRNKGYGDQYRDLTKEETAELERLGRWVKEACDMFGALPETGYKCAGVFVEGLRREWTRIDNNKEKEARLIHRDIILRRRAIQRLQAKQTQREIIPDPNEPDTLISALVRVVEKVSGRKGMGLRLDEAKVVEAARQHLQKANEA